jgi:Fic family protein
MLTQTTEDTWTSLPDFAVERLSRALGMGRYVTQPLGYRTFVPSRIGGLAEQDLESSPIGLDQSTKLALSACEDILRGLSQRSLQTGNPLNGNNRTKNHNSSASEDATCAEALEYGISRISSEPLSMKVLIEVHKILLKAWRESGPRSAGIIRNNQNWCGGSTGPYGATYVPPPPEELADLLADLDIFLGLKQMPACVQAIVASGQFKLIHPFSDGNGRLGRILLLLVLSSRGISVSRQLTIEAYFRQVRRNYLAEMIALQRASSWNRWIRFALTALTDCAHALADGRRD